MSQRLLPILALCLTAAAASAAYGQFGGGGMGGGMGGHHGGGRNNQQPAQPDPPPDNPEPQPMHLTATDKVEIVGVITAIDPATDRVTISYGEVDALNWPAGTTPFVVAKHSLLQGATVGEKVQFRIESQQISALEPYQPRQPQGDGS